jgi:hypothetical protein
MILKKLAGSIRKQDWFTVVLEILVVVIGILIGLQVDAWNQARLDQEEASYHLSFLYEELSEAITLADAEIERSQAILQNSSQASQLLTQDVWDEEEEARFKEMIFSTFQLWGPKTRPVSLRRLIDDGKLDLIEKDLQKAILRYESACVDAIGQTETSYSYSLVLTPKITASMRFSGPNIISNAEELIGNETLRAAVRDKAIWQRIQLDVIEGLQVDRRKLKQTLEDHLSGLTQITDTQ